MKKTKKKKGGCLTVSALMLMVSALCVALLLKFGGEGKAEYPASSDWRLTLVNGDNPVPDDRKQELAELGGGVRVDARIYPFLLEMFGDMEKEGIYAVAGEGYRTAEEQRQMMEDKIAAYVNEGCSEKRAERLAAREVAPVDRSEHQLGLAVDINGDKVHSSNEEVYSWLAENAYRYGFIQRYPEGKTEITGIEYEPWHYRYVGKEAAEEIFSRRICLEEYLLTLCK